MKASHFVMLLIVAFSTYLIQLWEPQYTAPLYLGILSLCILLGLVLNNINLTHIALFLVVINGLEYGFFQMGVIDLVAKDSDYLTKGTVIFGIQFLISVFAVLLFIFRVQLSRKISNSDKVALTHFDTFFHWFFILSALNCFIALLENVFRNIYDLEFRFFYDIYPSVAYVLWALTCGSLVTMVILSLKDRNSTVAH
ncbi:hypothetical protein [Pseudoalteromonas rubra]|uniref:Uncharacterized protein n=1 Tax=Pseudoalteromonas rubra TaxID=43658 RepID=A0A0F4QXV5_9GAMM|nr:hypothetical protein [Pseudoalteromonas rubra]KJZ12174.1 hypothetical protein TW77_03670 [Pseudoalteromonas rubra]